MDTEETTPVEATPEEVVAPETEAETAVVEEEETAPVAEEEAPAV